MGSTRPDAKTFINIVVIRFDDGDNTDDNIVHSPGVCPLAVRSDWGRRAISPGPGWRAIVVGPCCTGSIRGWSVPRKPVLENALRLNVLHVVHARDETNFMSLTVLGVKYGGRGRAKKSYRSTARINDKAALSGRPGSFCSRARAAKT